MKMLSVHPEHVRGTRPRIYVLPIFEIGDTKHVPENKTELQAKLKTGKAQLFHKRICASCHAIPNLTQWEKQMETEDLDVFTIGKRVGKHRVWEAFYVGTKEDPLFDERYSWEGQGNKMSQVSTKIYSNLFYYLLLFGFNRVLQCAYWIMIT